MQFFPYSLKKIGAILPRICLVISPIVKLFFFKCIWKIWNWLFFESILSQIQSQQPLEISNILEHFLGKTKQQQQQHRNTSYLTANSRFPSFSVQSGSFLTFMETFIKQMSHLWLTIAIIQFMSSWIFTVQSSCSLSFCRGGESLPLVLSFGVLKQFFKNMC